MRGRPVMRPSRTETLLDVAGVIARRSTCNRLSVGALVAREGRILVTGYNGPVAGMRHCNHEVGTGIPCDEAVHAEANAIAFAARHGCSCDGAEMYVTHAPCIPCARLIVNAGIVRVWYHNEFRDMRGVDFLLNAGVAISRA